MKCLFCENQNAETVNDPRRNSALHKCPNCGEFIITAPALGAAGDDAWKLCPHVFEQNARGITPTFYSTQSAVTPNSAPGSIGVDTVIEAFPKDVAERLDRALLNLASATKCLGQQINIRADGCNPLLLAKNTTEVFFTLQHFQSEGYISRTGSSLPAEISLTGKGLKHVSDLQRGLFGSQNKQAFVAMSFHKSLDAAYADGLKLGIEDCGYKALRVDAKEHNEKICDVIIAEIRNSRFLVADFTDHRNGVYFEAGLMMGLGRPVVFTCRGDEMGKAHFDTRQYNHIAWDTPADLREKLKRRIQATIAP
jgi:hypothetical protein